MFGDTKLAHNKVSGIFLVYFNNCYRIERESDFEEILDALCSKDYYLKPLKNL